ncbi:MAG: FtsX-like permease family protein [Ginsengibacter sp.]
MKLSYKKIKPLIVIGDNQLSKWMGYFGLLIGVLLLLVSIQMLINIQDLLKENSPRKNGFDFISISKTITNENMGKDNTFSAADINKIKDQPTINAVSPLISNQFRVRATAGNILPFSTDLFLESLDNSFIDTVPPTFTWQPGQQQVPVIFSSDFLEMYNVFAPAQGLPQLSEKTISSVNIFLECSGPLGNKTYTGNIVALTDRINSILVPAGFMDYNNKVLSGDTTLHASRIYIKTKDANDPQFISYLDSQNFNVNKDKLQFGRIKGLLQKIVGALGIFGLLVIILALMVFSFYLQLMIAKSKENLKLLLTLGYSTKWLSESVAKTWLPVYLVIIFIGLILTQIFQLSFREFSFSSSEKLPWMLHWSVWVTAIFLLALTVFISLRLVKKELKQIVYDSSN